MSLLLLFKSEPKKTNIHQTALSLASNTGSIPYTSHASTLHPPPVLPPTVLLLNTPVGFLSLLHTNKLGTEWLFCALIIASKTVLGIQGVSLVKCQVPTAHSTTTAFAILQTALTWLQGCL